MLLDDYRRYEPGVSENVRLKYDDVDSIGFVDVEELKKFNSLVSNSSPSNQ